MNNAQMDRFVKNPIVLEKHRSKFDLSHDRLLTIMAGRLIPILCTEVMPGDTFTLDLQTLCRMTTPLHPVMDNAFLDVHFFFVPNRIVWDHWKQFMGESDSAPWLPATAFTIPQLNINQSIVAGSIASYLDIPLSANGYTVSHLPFRGYVMIWNNFYRDENLMTVANIYKSGLTQMVSQSGTGALANYENYINNGTYVNAAENGAAPLPVCRMHDMYSSALPLPQRGPDVTINLAGYAPVQNMPFDSATVFSPKWYNASGGVYADYTGGTTKDVLFGTDATLGQNGTIGYKQADANERMSAYALLNLGVNLSSTSVVTISQLRNAIMVQRYYECLARGGARYFEQIRAFYGVVVPDATVQIPEFLGGRRIPINITQVAQTSESTTNHPLGGVSAYSLTTDADSIFTKSFTEHGYLFGLCCVRTEHSYQQGIPRHFSRLTPQDYYNPLFAFCSEQPIYNKELFVTGNATTDNQVFGYRAAWDEYRCHPNRISGEFLSDYAQSLDSYHYADDYPSTPILSAGWIKEPADTVYRTLVAQTHDQFLLNFHFNLIAVRPMPVYSVPGLTRF